MGMAAVITAIVVLVVAALLIVRHLTARIRELERDRDNAWHWAQWYKVLAWRWHDRATIARGLEPYWDWAEDGAYPALAERQEGELHQ